MLELTGEIPIRDEDLIKLDRSPNGCTHGQRAETK
jgi:hypothetical protein